MGHDVLPGMLVEGRNGTIERYYGMNGRWESLQNLSVPKLKKAGLSDSFCVNYPPIRSMPRKS